MFGAHEAIPDPEIKPIISFELAMVHVVMDGGVEYFEEERASETARHDLISQVTIYVDDKADDRKHGDGEDMDGEDQRDHQQHGAFGPGFDEMKGIGGPGRGVGRAMMQQVGEPEYSFMMQEPVHPIEICVVDDEAKDQAEDQPYDGMIGEITIYKGVF
jgi:hypothetical protein